MSHEVLKQDLRAKRVRSWFEHEERRKCVYIFSCDDALSLDIPRAQQLQIAKILGYLSFHFALLTNRRNLQMPKPISFPIIILAIRLGFTAKSVKTVLRGENMSSADDLKTYKKDGENWYESYAGKSTAKSTMVIMPSTFPNPLSQSKSIYSRRLIFDLSTSIVQKFYEQRGIKVLISGPQGLGATGGLLFGAFVLWLIAHKDLLKFIPFLFRLAQTVFRKYKHLKRNHDLAVLRSTNYRLRLDLMLHIDEGYISEDLVPYLQQLVASVPSLKKHLKNKLPYVEHEISLAVYDLRSEARIFIDLSSTDRVATFSSAISRLGKVKPSDQWVSLRVKKGRLWDNITVYKK